MSNLSKRNRRHDRYYKKAKEDGYASRAVYKLQELDRRFKLLRPGDRVVDLGCWPGSWLQYAGQRVGHRGMVVGLDLKAVDLRLPKQVVTIQGDVTSLPATRIMESLGGSADILLSDMAPHTTGVRMTDVARSIALVERALDLSAEVVKPNGRFLAKVFQGPGFDDLLLHAKALYRRTKAIRPKGSRSGSMELYLVALERRLVPLPEDGNDGRSESPAAHEPAAGGAQTVRTGTHERDAAHSVDENEG
ncbi:MAG: RlmE family RNA methyltransferase [Deltaproteobacteria bacterium]|nr:RlmE family RNA methyltransferase [Deltaproteobacteria bacterium]